MLVGHFSKTIENFLNLSQHKHMICKLTLVNTVKCNHFRKKKTYQTDLLPGDLGHRWDQQGPEGGMCTCLDNNYMQRWQHAGNTGSDKAEPVVLEGPPKTHQTPHRGHMVAGKDK